MINDTIITYFGQPARVVCDRQCNKAWGINTRPRIQFDPAEPDDYAFLADDELGEAPADPGTYEGGDSKPASPDAFPNKWCVRQCERSAVSDPGKAWGKLAPPSFATRDYNMPWLHERHYWEGRTCDACGRPFTLAEWDARETPHRVDCPNYDADTDEEGMMEFTECDCDRNYHSRCFSFSADPELTT